MESNEEKEQLYATLASQKKAAFDSLVATNKEKAAKNQIEAAAAEQAAKKAQEVASGYAKKAINTLVTALKSEHETLLSQATQLNSELNSFNSKINTLETRLAAETNPETKASLKAQLEQQKSQATKKGVEWAMVKDQAEAKHDEMVERERGETSRAA